MSESHDLCLLVLLSTAYLLLRLPLVNRRQIANHHHYVRQYHSADLYDANRNDAKSVTPILFAVPAQRACAEATLASTGRHSDGRSISSFRTALAPHERCSIRRQGRQEAMASRLNRRGPGGLHGLQAGEEVRTFFLRSRLERARFDPGTRWVKFYGRANSPGLRRTDGR